MIREPVKLIHVESVDAMMKRLNELHTAGELRALMVTYFDSDGYVNNYWSGLPSTSRAVGALEMLKYEILMSAK